MNEDALGPIEYHARFRRYEPPVVAALSRISAALARITDADILPAAENQLRSSAKVGTIHYSTLIEGNELDQIEADRAVRGVLTPDTQAKIELVNYVEALDFLDRRAEEGAAELTPEFIKEVHGIASKGLGSEESEHFKPRHEGEWRDGTAVVADRVTGTVFHRAPPPGDVPGLIAGLCEWVTKVEARPGEYPPAVIAANVHYAITDIHPFADVNGRAARLLTVALLMRHDQVPQHIFSFERYYAEDREAYYDALRSVRRRTLNMETWLEYFLRGLADEYERVANKVARLARLGLRASRAVQLTHQQEKGLVALGMAELTSFTRADYQREAKISRSAAIRDLRQLKAARVITGRGDGPAARYYFPAAQPEETRGRTRKWTDEQIEADLRELCAGRTAWPPVAEFKEGGPPPLYQAVVRNGGADEWARRLGLTRRGQEASD